MWPGSSPVWRKRRPSPNTKPRLGNNRNPQRASAFPYETFSPLETTSVPSLINEVLRGADRRQIYGEAALEADESQDGQDDSGDEQGEGTAPAATFNNGMWTPSAISSLASPTMANTATIASLTAPSATDPSPLFSVSSMAMSSSTLSSKPILSAATKAATSSSSQAALSSTASYASLSASPTPTSSHGSNGGFKLVYLTPIIVFVGLLLLFSVVGRIWGRIHHASRLEAARRAKYDQRASCQARKREMQRIKTMWGYDTTPMLPSELESGEQDLLYKDPSAPLSKHREGQDASESSFGSDSDSGLGQDEKYPGTFKILSLALLGEGSKPTPPVSRNESGRKYETELQGNSWLAVKISRWARRHEKDTAAQDTRYTSGPLRAGTAASRRLRHVLSRDGLQSTANSESWNGKDGALSPTTTLSVGSGEYKHKAEFEAMDLRRGAAQAYDMNDPFIEKNKIGWRKPLPAPPKESPFRPAIMNFGLRSRSKTYDPISLRDAAPGFDTPQKPAPSNYHRGEDGEAAVTGLLSKSFGLGISGVWKAVTGFGTPVDLGRPKNILDEESFVARPYDQNEVVMSESDTPYSSHCHSRYGEMDTPTKTVQLSRAATVLNVKSTTNQPWNTRSNNTPNDVDKRITTAAFNEAILASPINKQPPISFQPLTRPTAASVASNLTRSPSKASAQQGLAPRKSLLLRQAIAANEGVLSPPNGVSPVLTDYSELVACYSTPSDAATSPGVAQSIRALSPPAIAPTSTDGAGARAKLQRAKTSKLGPTEAVTALQRSKTASTSAASERNESRADLSRKGTVHRSTHNKQRSVVPMDEHDEKASIGAGNSLYPYQLTQPLRLSKQGDPSVPAVAIPSRGSSSPSKPQMAWDRTQDSVPKALRIASPEPLLTSPIRESRHKQQLSYDVSSAYSQDVIHRGFAKSDSPADASPPKRSKAVSNRSVESDASETREGGMARTAVQKARNRSQALLTVDQIMSQSYASQLPSHSRYHS